MKQDDRERLLACRRCPRMRAQFRRLRAEQPDYWNRPVPPAGAVGSPLLIVGLAPGLHGANRTGVPFTGDASGEVLFRTLEQAGIREAVEVTNAVKCLPPKNLPNANEINNCQAFLRQDLQHRRVILALGGVAHRAVIRALGLKQRDAAFAHGAVHTLGDIRLFDSYHCSRYNTQTGRLTEPMLLSVVESAAYAARLTPTQDA